MTEEVTYFKSAGLREIEFARIVKASLQLGKSAKSPQTSTPVPGWEICGDSEHFRPPRKMRAAKIASTPTGKNRKRWNLGGFEPATLGIERVRYGDLGTKCHWHCWVLRGGGTAGAALVPPAWGTPGWRGWAHCGALWCFPHCSVATDGDSDSGFA